MSNEFNPDASELIDIEIDEFDVADVDSSNYLGIDDIGPYHFVVHAIDTKRGQTKTFVNKETGAEETVPAQMVVTLAVVAPEEKMGKKTTLYLNKSGKMAQQSVRFAKAVGLVTQDQLNEISAARKAGDTSKRLAIPYGMAEGLPLFAELELDEYKGKKKAKVGWKMYHLEDSRCADFPCNEVFREGTSDDPFANA